jgi:hypothetical protein
VLHLTATVTFYIDDETGARVPLPANIDEIMLEMDEADSEVGDGDGGSLANADACSNYIDIAQDAELDDEAGPPSMDDAAYIDVGTGDELAEEIDVDDLNFDLDDLDDEDRQPLPQTRSGVIGNHRAPYREDQVREAEWGGSNATFTTLFTADTAPHHSAP